MLEFFKKIATLWRDVFFKFDEYPLVIGDYKVSLSALLFAFLVVGFFISFYWKGAKT